MKLRIICKVQDFGAATHIGGDVIVEYKTFDIEAPAVIEWLSKQNRDNVRSIVGVEARDD